MSEELSGEEIMRQNMAALDAGEEMPHTDDSFDEEITQENTELESEFNDDHQEETEEEIPEIAKKDGFMSKDDWVASGKDPDEYMSPDDFAKVGELRDGDMTRQQLSKQLVQSQSVMKEILANQQKAIKDAEIRAKAEAIAELEIKKKEAIEYGDAEKAVELDREISKQSYVEPEQPEANPVEQSMQQWYGKNDDWYGTHSGATDLLNVELKRAERQGLPFDEGIKQAENAVKSQFNYLFDEAPQKEKPKQPRSVSTQTRKPAKQAQKLSIKSLPPEMQTIAKTVIKKTGISEQEYMESYNG